MLTDTLFRQRRVFFLIPLALLLYLPTQTALAHISGFTDSSLQITKAGILLLYTTPTDNLNELVEEAKDLQNPSRSDPTPYFDTVLNHFRLIADNQACSVRHRDSRLLPAIKSTQFRFEFDCPDQLQQLSIEYDLFFNKAAGHRNLTRVFLAGKRLTFNFTNKRRALDVPVGKLLNDWDRDLANEFQQIDPNQNLVAETNGDNSKSSDGSTSTPNASMNRSDKPGSIDSGFVTPRFTSDGFFSSLNPAFFTLGVEHILFGLDHVLFVIVLVLLPASFARLATLVTAFTIAHSITLSLSVLDILTLPPAFTEAVIALSIAVVSFTTIHSALKSRRARDWAQSLRGSNSTRVVIAFVFGLIHGFGFSYILKAMGLGEDRLGALLLFNLGVEAGQLAIVVLLLPLLSVLFRSSKGWRTISINAGLALVVSSYWFVERLSVAL